MGNRKTWQIALLKPFTRAHYFEDQNSKKFQILDSPGTIHRNLRYILWENLRNFDYAEAMDGLWTDWLTEAMDGRQGRWTVLAAALELEAGDVLETAFWIA